MRRLRTGLSARPGFRTLVLGAAPALALLPLLALLSACGSGEPEPEAQDTSVPDAIAGMQAGPAQAARGQQVGTPNKDRVVTLGVLNKRNNLTQDLVMKPGESKRLGNLVVKVATCEKSLPWERPQEEGPSSRSSSRSGAPLPRSWPGTRSSRAGCSATRPRSTWSSTRSTMSGSRAAR